MVVAELNPGLVRLARTYVSAELADEVVQETWVAVVRSLDSFEERSTLATWIYRILLNKVRTLAQREAKIIPFAAMGHTGDGDHPIVDPERLLHPEKVPVIGPELLRAGRSCLLSSSKAMSFST